LAGTAFLFPGQGSQSVGMDGHLREPSGGLLDSLDELSGVEGLERILREGPEEQLTRTDRVQPAITAVSLAALRVLAAAGIRPSAAAGHSLGEYSALVCAGVISEESALRLTARRGSLMQACADRRPGGMTALIGASADQAAEIVAAAGSAGLIGIANINSEGQVVLSGESAALEKASLAAKEMGIRKVIPLKVSGAWHSPLMGDAATSMKPVLDAEPFADPSIPVVANVTASPVSSGAESRELLGRQITSPVLWALSMKRLVDMGIDTFVEVGPGAVLQGLLRSYGGLRVFGTGNAEALETVLRDLS